jgi:hypothetical protein
MKIGFLIATVALVATAATSDARPALVHGRPVLVRARPALFHARLVKAQPGVNETVTVSPDSLKLWFSERVELPLSKVALKGGGAVKMLGALAFGGPGADAPMVVAVRDKLAPGTYTVDWTVAGKDGHPTKGSFAFVVKPAR